MRILAIKLSSLGDLFHALPAVHRLKQSLSAEVDWVTQPEYAGLVGCFDDVARVLAYPRRGPACVFRSFLSGLRREKYDLVVDFQGLLKSALVCAAARADRRIGPSFHRECSRLFYTDVAGRRDKCRHAVDENMDVVRMLGLDPGPAQFPMTFPAQSLELRRPVVAVLPASRWATKTWPEDLFVQTIGLLGGAGVGTVVLLGAGDDAELCSRIARQAGGGADIVNMAGRLSLEETGGFLREVDVLLSNDSGPVHMAAALGTRTVVVFGPTDPVRTGPFGAGHRVLRGSLDCQPCFSRSCALGTRACLHEVTPRQAAEAVFLGCMHGDARA